MMRIYVRHPDQADNLVPAIVEEKLGKQFVVRFLESISFGVGTETTVLFHDEANCFTSVPCRILRILSEDPQTGVIMLTGEAAAIDSRSTSRIDVVDQNVTATVNSKYSGEVINMSCEGIALLLDLKEPIPDPWLDVTLAYGGNEFEGRMQVRNRSQEKDGRIRYGLMAASNGTELLSQLPRIIQDIQRLSEQRTAPGDVSEEAVAPSETDQQEEQEDSAPPEESKRESERAPWPGIAKVYLRESKNLRVLSVDTQDLSRGGISFIATQYIYEGCDALFEKPIEGGFFRVMISIRNVRVEDGGMHRVGAQFIGGPMQGGKIPEAYDASKVA